MKMIDIFIACATVVFTLLSFVMPVPQPYWWGLRGATIILAIVGWLLCYQIFFH